MTSPAAQLDWLLSFSDPERGIGWNPRSSPAVEWKVGRARALLDQTSAPDRALRVVTVAGTNGKGSTGAVLESIARAGGLRTGHYSQPHLHDFRERIRIDGAPVGPHVFARGIERLRPLVSGLARHHPAAGEPTAFDLTTVLAALLFVEAGVDLAVMEVGLGGRLDAVNALSPAMCVVTSIGHDHTHILGSTLGAIAREKAGVFRPGVVALSARQRAAAAQGLGSVADRVGARLEVVDPLARVGRVSDPAAGQPVRLDGRKVRLGLLGGHQRQNAALAARAARLLGLPDTAVEAGLREVRWPGRLEWFPGKPPVLIDGAHNPPGALALAGALDEIAPRGRRALVFGCFRDKAANGLLRPLVRKAAAVWTAAADEPRAADPRALAEVASALGAEAQPSPSVAEALKAAMASGPDVVVVAGSLRVVAEAREALGLH